MFQEAPHCEHLKLSSFVCISLPLLLFLDTSRHERLSLRTWMAAQVQTGDTLVQVHDSGLN